MSSTLTPTSKGLMAAKSFNKLNFKERLVHHLHNELIFGCTVKLKEDEFHLCKECERKANSMLFFFGYEISKVRQEKIDV